MFFDKFFPFRSHKKPKIPSPEPLQGGNTVAGNPEGKNSLLHGDMLSANGRALVSQIIEEESHMHTLRNNKELDDNYIESVLSVLHNSFLYFKVDYPTLTNPCFSMRDNVEHDKHVYKKMGELKDYVYTVVREVVSKFLLLHDNDTAIRTEEDNDGNSKKGWLLYTLPFIQEAQCTTCGNIYEKTETFNYALDRYVDNMCLECFIIRLLFAVDKDAHYTYMENNADTCVTWHDYTRELREKYRNVYNRFVSILEELTPTYCYRNPDVGNVTKCMPPSEHIVHRYHTGKSRHSSYEAAVLTKKLQEHTFQTSYKSKYPFIFSPLCDVENISLNSFAYILFARPFSFFSHGGTEELRYFIDNTAFQHDNGYEKRIYSDTQHEQDKLQFPTEDKFSCLLKDTFTGIYERSNQNAYNEYNELNASVSLIMLLTTSIDNMVVDDNIISYVLFRACDSVESWIALTKDLACLDVVCNVRFEEIPALVWYVTRNYDKGHSMLPLELVINNCLGGDIISTDEHSSKENSPRSFFYDRGEFFTAPESDKNIYSIPVAGYVHTKANKPSLYKSAILHNSPHTLLTGLP